jgi:hypothetical protein
MLEGKTRIPPVDVETLPDDLRETLEEQRKLRGARHSIHTSSTRATRRSYAPRRGCGPPCNKRRSACPVR